MNELRCDVFNELRWLTPTSWKSRVRRQRVSFPRGRSSHVHTQHIGEGHWRAEGRGVTRRCCVVLSGNKAGWFVASAGEFWAEGGSLHARAAGRCSGHCSRPVLRFWCRCHDEQRNCGWSTAEQPSGVEPALLRTIDKIGGSVGERGGVLQPRQAATAFLGGRSVRLSPRDGGGIGAGEPPPVANRRGGIDFRRWHAHRMLRSA